MLTSTKISRYLSVSSTILVLGLNVAILAQIKKISSTRQPAVRIEQPVKSGDVDGAYISQIWQGKGNLQDLQIDDRYQLRTGITPQASIDWDNTEIGIDNDFQLNL